MEWNLGLIELLLDSGAHLDVRDRKNKTPLDLALENGRHDVASFLATRSGNLRALAIVNTIQSEVGLQEGLPNEIVGQDLKGGHSSSSSNSLHSALVSRKIDAL